jgi:hypothetical protein
LKKPHEIHSKIQKDYLSCQRNKQRQVLVHQLNEKVEELISQHNEKVKGLEATLGTAEHTEKLREEIKRLRKLNREFRQENIGLRNRESHIVMFS